jgi:hypothetical protein
MFSGMKKGRVEMKAIRPEMKRMAKAYEVLNGRGRICDLGVERRER